MPLNTGKSPKAFSSNIKTEMNAGKPQKQALAIAYAIRRKNKMSQGGVVNEEYPAEHPDDHLVAHDQDMREIAHEDGLTSFAEGGEVSGMDEDDVEINDNFLSAEDQHSVFDSADLRDEPVEDLSKKNLMDGVMRKIRMRHMGR